MDLECHMQNMTVSSNDYKLSGQLKAIISSYIKINENEVMKSKSIVEQLKHALIFAMRNKNKLFDALYSEFYHSGSSYIGLKIAEPDEFDLNLILKLPFKVHEFEMINDNSIPPSYTACKLNFGFSVLMTPNHPKYAIYKAMAQWFNSDGYLLLDPVINWMQGIVDSIIGSLEIDNVNQIRRSCSGPAITLKVSTTLCDKPIDVDLVPVFRFKNNEKWPTTIEDISEQFPRIAEYHKFWFIVPKAVKNGRFYGIDYMWRMDFPDMEKQLIHDQGCIKSVIKLLKLLRNTQHWKCIASYHLKTVMMLEIIKQPSTSHWTEDNLGTLFMHALEILADRLARCNIPFIFDRNANLLDGRVSQATASNISGQIRGIIKEIRKDHNSIKAFLIPPSQSLQCIYGNADLVNPELQQQQSSCSIL